jgi:OOP family OmpA-OmpF porin
MRALVVASGTVRYKTHQMKRSLAAWAIGAVPLLAAEVAEAAEPAGASAGASAKVDAKGAKTRKRTTNADWRRIKWIKRWAPQRNLGELGISAGVFLPNPQHDLYDPTTRPSEPFWNAGPDIAFRGGFYPLRSLGVEAEFNAMPTRMRTITNDPIFLYGFQAHAVFQLPYYSVVPFFLVGGGLLGVRSNVVLQGRDVDGALHYGAGVKIHLTKVIGLRFEARNIMSATEALQNAGAAHVQVLGGIIFTLGRKPPPPEPIKPPPPDPDRDKDGILNAKDQCPDTAGVEPHGCPDSDGDTFIDSKDACPEVPGVAPDGCPVKDTDEDGFLDPDDDCVFEKETPNNYKDDDGCPDDLPPEVKKFSGTIAGIEFDTKKDTIRPVSKPVLDKAVEVLKEFTDISVNIVGHTDDVGAPEFNLDLSKRRAEAVKKYLVDKGIDASRITTEGRGMTDPEVPNDSEANRAKNRRIEFEVRSTESAPATPADPAKPDAPKPDAPKPADAAKPND